MNWLQGTIMAGAILSLGSLLDMSARVTFWPNRACRILDASMNKGGVATRHVYLARLRLWLAAIAVFVIFIQGLESLLFWVPSSWGSVSEDGEWTATRTSASGLLALYFTALLFAATCARAESHRENGIGPSG